MLDEGPTGMSIPSPPPIPITSSPPSWRRAQRFLSPLVRMLSLTPSKIYRVEDEPSTETTKGSCEPDIDRRTHETNDAARRFAWADDRDGREADFKSEPAFDDAVADETNDGLQHCSSSSSRCPHTPRRSRRVHQSENDSAGATILGARFAARVRNKSLSKVRSRVNTGNLSRETSHRKPKSNRSKKS